MTNDYIEDFLIRLKNAALVEKSEVMVPNIKQLQVLADLLQENGYIVATEKVENGKQIRVELGYKEDGRPAITGTRRVSKLSQRVYTGSRDIRPVKGGHGILVVSTPQGVMTGERAREAGLGGEVLCQVW